MVKGHEVTNLDHLQGFNDEQKSLIESVKGGWGSEYID